MATFSTSDRVTLHYTDEGAGPPVVLLGGFGAPAGFWEFQRLALLDAGLRVLVLDRRSHGRSQAPAFGQRMGRHGKDVHDFLDAAGLADGVVLIGGSQGASTAWAYCDLFGTGRLRGVVSVDQTPKMINDGDWQAGFYGLTAQTAGAFFTEGIPQTGRGRPANRMEGFVKLAAALGGPPAFADTNTPPMRALLFDHAAQDWRDVIARLEVPSLFLAGADSQFWPAEHATLAAAGNELAQAVILADCGHAAGVDQPELVNAAILEFLR